MLSKNHSSTFRKSMKKKNKLKEKPNVENKEY